MDDTIIFIVGFVIFCLYLIGFLAVIYTQNKIQDEELENDPEIKLMITFLSNIFFAKLKCCLAKISVGAINAT